MKSALSARATWYWLAPAWAGQLYSVGSAGLRNPEMPEISSVRPIPGSPGHWLSAPSLLSAAPGKVAAVESSQSPSQARNPSVGGNARAEVAMDQLLQGLRAAAEPTRLRILALCAHGELSVSDLTQILGQSQPRVSRHLKLMCDAGLLDRFREGTRGTVTTSMQTVSIRHVAELAGQLAA